MSAGSFHHAHHFDDAEEQYVAAECGMWVLLSSEVLFFGGMFTCYAVYRLWYHASFLAASQRLDVVLGTINTAVLLTSSLTMALAVRGAQLGAGRRCAAFAGTTIVLGCLFLGIKGYEYHQKFVEHLVPGPHYAFYDATVVEAGDEASRSSREGTGDEYPGGVRPAARSTRDTAALSRTQLFFSFYFAMTGLHALHMAIGLAVLGAIGVAAWRGRYSPQYFTPVEMTGLYWHFVDMIWVFLFPLLYLIR